MTGWKIIVLHSIIRIFSYQYPNQKYLKYLKQIPDEDCTLLRLFSAGGKLPPVNTMAGESSLCEINI